MSKITKLNFNNIDKLLENKFQDLEIEIVLNKFINFAKERWSINNDVSSEILKIVGYAEIIKDDVKNGQITVENQKIAQELGNLILNENIKIKFHDEIPATFYQTMGLLSEQFFRWGDSANAKKCVESAENKSIDGKEILKAISKYNQQYSKEVFPLCLTDAKITKEQIRFCLAYIQTSIHMASDYENILTELENCRDFVEYIVNKHNDEGKKKNEKPDDEWNGTQALIAGHFGRCHRNRLEYSLATRNFGQSINFYEKRFTSNQKNNSRKTQEKSSIQNKMALTLILGYAWMDIQRGEFSKGIYNSLYPAQTLLTEMDDQLARCYLELLETTAQRGLSLPKYLPVDKVIDRKPLFEIDNVLKKAEKVLEDFEKLEVPKFTLRAKYEYIMCLVFSKKWTTAINAINKIFKDKKTIAEDRFWHIKFYLLKARLLALLKHYEDRPIPLNDIIANLEYVEPFTKDHKQMQLEFYLTTGEVYLSYRQTRTAAANFEKVRKLNRNKVLGNDTEPLNPRVEARSLLRLAEIDIQIGSIYKAEDKIRYWEHNLSQKVDDFYLHNLAHINLGAIEQKKEDELNIRIEKPEDLNYNLQNKKLKKFLLIKARLEAEKRDESVKAIISYLKIKKSTYYNWRNDPEINLPKE